MKKKIFVLVVAVLMFAMMLTGCIRNDIGVKMNRDGSGSISVTIGIAKDVYQELLQLGADPLDGKTPTEYTYEDITYVAYTEEKKYDSYEDMEKALLEMTYDTEAVEDAQQALDADLNGETEDAVSTNDGEFTIPKADNHIFSSVNMDKNGGIFYTSYTFNAVMNPQSNTGLDYDMNEVFKIMFTVEMPEKITQAKGGKVDGNKITFDIADVTERQELAAACESNNTGVVIGIVIGLVVLVAGLFCYVKFKK